MVNKNLVSFRRTDIVPSHIEEYGKQYADHFKVKRDYIPQFCRLIQTSKRWTIDNLEESLNVTLDRFPLSAGRKFISLVKESFSSCQSKEEISELRGVMLESLIIGIHGGSSVLNNDNYGWGAKVDLNLPSQEVKIRYRCVEAKEESCGDRSTVDFGHWDNYNGKFYECKVQPRGIGCAEVSYMQLLKSELEQHEISHEIFFACPAPRDEVKMRLESFGLGPVYHPFGIEDIKKWHQLNHRQTGDGGCASCV